MGFTDEVNLILIGRLGKPVGLKGYINLIAHSDNPSGLSKYEEFFIDANGIHKFTLDKISKSGKNLTDFDDDEMEGMIADEERNLKGDQLKAILVTLLTMEGLTYLAEL